MVAFGVGVDGAKNMEGQKVSPLSKKFPTLSVTGDKDMDKQNQKRREAFMKVIDKLWFHPELIIPTCIELECGMIKAETGAVTEAETFDADWATLSRIPKHWIAQWIINNSNRTISQGGLNRIDIANGDNIRNMFSFFTGTRSTMPLHKEMRHKTVASRVFTIRAEAIQSPLDLSEDPESLDAL